MQNVDYGPLFDSYATRFPNGLEYIGSTLYDTQTYTSGATTSLSFFTTKPANKTLGNIPLAGTLPDPQGFLIMSMRFYPQVRPISSARAAATTSQPGTADDVAQLLNTGVLLLQLENKTYGQFPLWMLPAGGGAVAYLAAEGATADPGGIISFGNNGLPDARNAYVLQQPLFIPPVTEIGVILQWPTALTLATPSPALEILFDGMMVRPIQ